MSETIPKDVMAAAMRALMVNQPGMVESVARAIMAEREACAKIAAGNSGDFDFGKALAECRDSEHGFHSGRLHAASAIRDRSKT